MVEVGEGSGQRHVAHGVSAFIVFLPFSGLGLVLHLLHNFREASGVKVVEFAVAGHAGLFYVFAGAKIGR